MARWKNKDVDQLDRYTKIRRTRKTAQESAIIADEFEKDESLWPGVEGSFRARVVEVHKRYAFVSTEPEQGKINTNDVWLADVARRYLQASRAERNFVSVGDVVLCKPATETARADTKVSDLPRCTIDHRAPRRSKLARLDPHTPSRYHVLAANMDQLMIMASYLHPTVKWGLIDRYLVLAEAEGLGVIIVLNKNDLLEGESSAEFVAETRAMEDIYRRLGYPVFSVQANAAKAERNSAIQEIGMLLKGKTTLLSGHSGVGKSSLINLFAPEIIQPVEEDANIFYKGRHTTTFASFLKLKKAKGYAIDTPGIRSFTFDEMGAIELSHCFIEFRPFLGQCKFRECRHMDEPGCVVQTAVADGRISRQRYKSYLGILLGASGREGRIRDLPLDE